MLCQNIKSKLKDGKCEINLKEISGLYTIDVTSNVLFGFNPETIDGKFQELTEALHAVHENYFKNALSFFASYCLPFLFESNFFGKKYVTFMRKLMGKIFEEREKSEEVRNDFVKLLIELKNRKELTEDEIFAQAAFFFFGGELKDF